MAVACQRQSLRLAEANDGIGAHSSELLSLQLWSLLHSFCNHPTDIKENFKVIIGGHGNVPNVSKWKYFKNIVYWWSYIYYLLFQSVAKILGTAIADKKELRLVVMASLRRLIASAKESENAEDLAEISRFDKNYLPILFNVYTTRAIGSDEEGQRLAALDTVKASITN